MSLMQPATRIVCVPTPDRPGPFVAHVRRDLTPMDLTFVLAELADDVAGITANRESGQLREAL